MDLIVARTAVDYLLYLAYVFISCNLSRFLQKWWMNTKLIKENRIFLHPVETVKMKDIFEHHVLLISIFFLSCVVLRFGTAEILKFVCFFIVIIFDRLIRFPETNNVLETYNLNIGYGAALCYYKNYLINVLPQKFLERVENFKAVNKVKMRHKLFILVPKSCKVPNYLADSETIKIERCRELSKQELTHSGIVGRIYNITVYLIRLNNSAKGVRVAVEYAQPLKGLFALKEKNKISEEEMFHQRKLFMKTLQSFLRDKHDTYKYCELIEYDDDKNTVAEVLYERCSAIPVELS